jgi:hypothetical protein
MRCSDVSTCRTLPLAVCAECVAHSAGPAFRQHLPAILPHPYFRSLSGTRVEENCRTLLASNPRAASEAHRHIKQHKDALNKAVRTMGTALRAVSNLQQSRTPVCVWGLAVTGPCRGPQGPQLHCAGSHPVRRPSLNLVRGAARSVDRRALRRAACPLAKRRRVRTYNSRAGGNLRPVMRLRR